MNYFDQNGINYSQIVKISYAIDGKSLHVHQNLPHVGTDTKGPGITVLTDERMKQFEETLEAYNTVVLFNDIKAKGVLQNNGFKPKQG